MVDFWSIGPFSKWNRKIGTIERIIAQPCAPDPVISVLAAWSATPYLLWSILKPDPIDNYIERFGKGHKRRRRYKMSFYDAWRGSIPQHTTDVSWAWWRANAFAQRIGWYFLLVDASLDYIINWSSMAYQWSGCPVPAGFSGSGHLPVIPRINTGTTHNLSGLWQGEAGGYNCLVQLDGGASTVSTQSGSGSLSVNIGPHPNPDVAFAPPAISLLTRKGLTITSETGMTLSTNPDGSLQYNGSTTDFPIATGLWSFVPICTEAAEGGYQINSANLTISGDGAPGFGPDP